MNDLAVSRIGPEWGSTIDESPVLSTEIVIASFESCSDAKLEDDLS